MPLNAHLAIFRSNFVTPSEGLPASDEELGAVEIGGESATVPVRSLADGADPLTPWIQLTAVRYSIQRQDPGGYSEVGGSINHSGVEIQKQIDIASPGIARHCAAQTTFGSAKILFLAADNSLMGVLRLYNVTIESVNAVYESDGSTSESLTLQYQKICWRRLLPNGSGRDDGWDRSGNAAYAAPGSGES